MQQSTIKAAPAVTPTVDLEDLKLIVENNHTYLADKYRLVSEYRREREINNDYKGRQLLELIQNADDAGSSYVRITVNTENNILQIENEGEPFTLGGFRSLMITNLSTKRKKKYIGNKGLGFRSVLNWSERVTVISAGVEVTFSQQQALNKFLELYPDLNLRNSILEEFEYGEDSVPFPVFALPSIVVCETPAERTTIEIAYNKDSKKEILEQIETLRKEVLLFLNSIQNIYISVDGVELNHISNRVGNLVFIDEEEWEIYDNKVNGEDPILPLNHQNAEVKEEESYSLKIAIKKDLSDNVNKLFTFFPTKIGIHFPMVIHGTFELDSSRNRIIDTKKNKFLVEELVNLLFKVAESFFEEKATWEKLRLLNYKNQKDTVLEEFGFYKAIDTRIQQLNVFPCLDGKYRSYSHVYYHKNDFSELIQKHSLQELFPDLILPIPTEHLDLLKKLFPNYLAKVYFQNEFRRRVQAASEEIYCSTTVSEYAKWIVAICTQKLSIGKDPIKILYDEKRELIESTSTVFTPRTQKASIDIPSHVDIDYIHSQLFDHLVKLFDYSNDNERSRKIRDKLNDFVNIQSFEPAPVLTRIVTSTNKLVGESTSLEFNQTKVRDMLRSLFSYYKYSNRAKDSQIRTGYVPVLNAKGEVAIAKKCFLSRHYPIGAHRLELLGDIYDDEQLIACPKDLGLADEELLEEFLIEFLGVNKYLHLEYHEDKTNVDQKYINLVFSIKGTPDKFRSAKASFTEIKNLEVVNKRLADGHLTREQFVYWICSDNEIKEKLNSYSETIFRYDLVNHSKDSFHRLNDVPSFIKYQLNSLGLFDDFVLYDVGIPIINDFQFAYKAELFNLIETTLIKSILSSLGAKDNFSSLSNYRIEEILKTLPIKDQQGKYARRIYQLAIERYKEKKEELYSKKGLLLHAKKGKVKAYFPYPEVYYADNIELPKKVLDDKPILNFPKRAGVQSVTTYFEIHTFNEINYTSDEYAIYPLATQNINAWIKKIKPYILVSRLFKLKSDQEISEAIKTIKSINLKLCDRLIYKLDNETHPAEEYDFVAEEGVPLNYLIKYQGNPEILDLKRDSILSDVVAEIYSIAFDVSNIRTEIRNIFRNEFEDTKHQITEEFGEESLTNAISKLGVSAEEISFWNSVAQTTDKKLPIYNYEDERNFKSSMATHFSLEENSFKKMSFEDLNSPTNYSPLKYIFSSLGISISRFNVCSQVQLSLEKYHIENLNTMLDEIKPYFIDSLWKHLKTSPIQKQKEFILLLKTVPQTLTSKLAKINFHYFDLDYHTEYINSVKTEFGFDLLFDGEPEENFIKQYESNKNKIKITEDKVNSLENSYRSLLYFDIPDSVLKQVLNRIKGNTTDQDEKQLSEDPKLEGQDNSTTPADTSLPIFELQKKSKKNSGNTGSKGKNTGSANGHNRSYSPGTDEQNRITGKKAEETVLKTLIHHYGKSNVIWLSGYSNHPEKSDTWGYDIKFRKNSEDNWQYCEVKSFYKNSFYFSDNEMICAKQNSERYFIFLVEENHISQIQFSKILNEEGELILYNEYFNIKVREYKFEGR